MDVKIKKLDPQAVIPKYAKPGDYIVHLGIGGTTSYNEVKEKLINGLNEGCKRYANN